jgi:hypothetical protein
MYPGSLLLSVGKIHVRSFLMLPIGCVIMSWMLYMYVSVLFIYAIIKQFSLAAGWCGFGYGSPYEEIPFVCETGILFYWTS